MVAQSSRISTLDGIRALAISTVIVAHAIAVFDPQENFVHELGHALGRCGVDLFFVLSGFLITSLLIKEHDRNGKIDLGAFFRRRTVRIFPAFYVFLIALGAFSLFVSNLHISPKDWLMDAAYISEYDFGFRNHWTEHVWSLAVEEKFYLLWPLLLVFMGRKKGLSLAAWCIFLEPFIRTALYFKFPAQRELLTTTFHTRCDMLMYGCVLGILLAERKNLVSAFLEKQATVKVMAAAAALVVGVLLDARFRGAYMLPIGFSIAGISAALLIAYVLTYPSATLSRVLSLPAVTWLGRISYSLYLWQQPFFNVANHSAFGRFPLDIICAMTFACASYYGIERPLIAMYARKAKSRSSHMVETGKLVPANVESEKSAIPARV